jgi:hypothetical protein
MAVFKRGRDPNYQPGTDYVSLVNQANRLPDADLRTLAAEPTSRGLAAKGVLSARMGLGDRLSDGAAAIPSSFPSSEVLRQIQGAAPGGPLPPLSEIAGTPSLAPPGPEPSAAALPVNTLEMAAPNTAPSLGPFSEQPRQTVVGAAPPPTRPEDAPRPPPPTTSQPALQPERVGLAATVAPASVAPEPTISPVDEEARKDRNMALMQAGLAILASKNRSGLGAIGEGGLVGLQGYQESKRHRAAAARDDKLMARQENRDERQMDMAVQKMELEKQLAEQRMALSREEMDITRSRYDPANPLNAAQILRDKAAAAASYASAARAKEGVGDGFNFGKSERGRAIQALVASGQLSVEQGAMYLAQRPVTGPGGEFNIMKPDVAGTQPAAAGGSTLTRLKEREFTPDERKAILESDDSVASAGLAQGALSNALDLNRKAFSGPTAGVMTQLDRVLPGDMGGRATTNYEQLIKTQVLDSLKSSFGAMPTEGERKYLEEVQASVNKTPDEREDILKRGIELAEQRKTREAARAKAMRGGSYYKEGASAAPPPAAARELTYDPATGEFK